MSSYPAARKALPGIEVRSFGAEVPFRPFLMVDLFDMDRAVFPPHRHERISVLTYLLPESETGMRNRDDIGSDLVIEPGALHWTTAGAGIVHHEMPLNEAKRAIGFQIFVELPADSRDRPPGILDLAAADVPTMATGGATVRCVLGRFGELASPLVPPVPIGIADIELEPDGMVELSIPGMADAFVFVDKGSAMVAGQRVEANMMARVALDGAAAELAATGERTRAFVFSVPAPGNRS